MIRGRSGNTEYGLPCRSIALASDHGGYALKQQLVEYVKTKYPNITVTDCGCFNGTDRVDYPDLVSAAAKQVQDKIVDRCIIVDGVGCASAMTANKFNGVRAACCWDSVSVKMARAHSDINCLTLGGQYHGKLLAQEIVDLFIGEKFEGDRHIPRLTKVENIEVAQSMNNSCSNGTASGSSALLQRSSVGAAASPFKLPL